MKEPNHNSDDYSWPSTRIINNAKHHLFQLTKGLLVSGIALSGYSLLRWLRAGGAAGGLELKPAGGSSIQPRSDQNRIIQAATDQNAQFPETFSRIDYTSRKYSDHTTKISHFHIDELEISFHDKEKLNRYTSTYTTDPVNLNPENISVIVGEEFRIKIPGYQVGVDGKTYYLSSLSGTKIDGSPLPSWLRLEPPPVQFLPNIMGMMRIKELFGGIALHGNLALVAASDSGLHIANISDPNSPTIIGTYPLGLNNPAMGVVAQSDIAFLSVFGGVSGGLRLIDIKDPRHPLLISTASPGPGEPSIVLGNKNMVIMGANSGLILPDLALIDVTDPKNPIILYPKIEEKSQSFVGDLLTAGRLAVWNNLLLVTHGNDLDLINITDPKNPTLLSNINFKQQLVRAVSLQGDVAIVATMKDLSPPSGGLLDFVDVSNPKRPVIFNNLTIADVRNVAMHGNFALVAAGAGGLQFIDLTNPRTPRIITQINTICDAINVKVQKHLALVACLDRVETIDLSSWTWTLSGTAPVNEYGVINSILLKASIQPNIQYQKNLRLYAKSRPHLQHAISNLNVRPGQVFSYKFTTELFDLGDGAIPFQKLRFSWGSVGHPLPSWVNIDYKPVIGTLPIPFTSGSCKVVAQGNLALVSIDRSAEGPQLVDISNPKQPIVISRLNYLGETSISMDKGLAAVGGGGNIRLKVLDISDPKDPKVIGNMDFPVWLEARNLAIRGKLVVVCGRDDLLLIDVSNPRSPTICGRLKGGGCVKIVIKNDLAICATGSSLNIIDVSDPRNPIKIGGIAAWGDYLAVQEGLALLSFRRELRLVDIHDPYHPSILSTLPFTEDTWGVSVQGKVALISTLDTIKVVSIEQPKSPTVIGTMDIFGKAYDLISLSNFFISTGDFGLNFLSTGLESVQLSGQPKNTDHAKYSIIIDAKNSDGISGNGTFWLSTNNPPEWRTLIVAKTVNVGQVLSFQLPDKVFLDKDGDALTFKSTLSNGTVLPSWITFFASDKFQIYTMIPNVNDRGQYNVSVVADDGYYGEAKAWFSLVVPRRKPVKVSEIPFQSAFVWRPFELILSPTTIFVNPDGDLLHYRAQLKGGSALPRWLSFDSLVCKFTGEPGVTNIEDLELEFVAVGPESETSAEFSISVKTSTLFQDLATYYSISGAGIVLFSLLARMKRWKKMKELDIVPNILPANEGEMKETQITRQTLEKQLIELSTVIESRQTLLLKTHTHQYYSQAVNYARQQPESVLEVGYPWKVIKNIGCEIENRILHQFNAEDTLVWVEALHLLLQVVFVTNKHQSRVVRKNDKEFMVNLINKVEKNLETHEVHTITIKQQLQLCHEALVSINDTDSIRDNLSCRDTDMLLEIFKTMIAPPYGMVSLMYQISNIPGGWYPIIIKLRLLSEQALTNQEKLTELQKLLCQQHDWRIVYEGVGFLGKIAQESEDEKIRKQSVEGIQSQTGGLTYYKNHRNRQWFWKRCSPCCNQSSAWIRLRASDELSNIKSGYSSLEADSESDVRHIQQPLLMAV